MVDKTKKNELTRYLIWPATISTLDRSIPLPGNLEGINPNNFKYILGIFAPAKDFLKITSYYLNSPDVTKIAFVFDTLDDDMIKAVSLVIKEFKQSPIHVSGFCMKNGKYIYELYISGKKQVANRIVQSVKKVIPNFESNIEEISAHVNE